MYFCPNESKSYFFYMSLFIEKSAGVSKVTHSASKLENKKSKKPRMLGELTTRFGYADFRGDEDLKMNDHLYDERLGDMGIGARVSEGP